MSHFKRFQPGQVIATPGASAAFEASGESLLGYLERHVTGDWGVVMPEDARENDYAIIAKPVQPVWLCAKW